MVFAVIIFDLHPPLCTSTTSSTMAKEGQEERMFSNLSRKVSWQQQHCSNDLPISTGSEEFFHGQKLDYSDLVFLCPFASAFLLSRSCQQLLTRSPPLRLQQQPLLLSAIKCKMLFSSSSNCGRSCCCYWVDAVGRFWLLMDH